MKLKPETVLRRRVELQVALRYQTELLDLRTQLSRAQSELAEERLKRLLPAERCACPSDALKCACNWCELSAEAAALCEGVRPAAVLLGDGVPDRAFVSP